MVVQMLKKYNRFEFYTIFFTPLIILQKQPVQKRAFIVEQSLLVWIIKLGLMRLSFPVVQHNKSKGNIKQS